MLDGVPKFVADDSRAARLSSQATVSVFLCNCETFCQQHFLATVGSGV